jgi:hypothetical protein
VSDLLRRKVGGKVCALPGGAKRKFLSETLFSGIFRTGTDAFQMVSTFSTPAGHRQQLQFEPLSQILLTNIETLRQGRRDSP